MCIRAGGSLLSVDAMWILYLTGFLAVLQLQQGATQPSTNRILGGRRVSVADYPYLMNLRHSNGMRCGGTLITPSCVLTAAHCLERNLQVSNLYVHAQQQCLAVGCPPAQVRQAWYALVPRDYGKAGLDSDLAIIKLRLPFDSASKASMIELDYNDLPQGANLTILGWGMTRPRCHQCNQCLQATNVNMLGRQVCYERLRPFSYFTDNMFCALGKANPDVCLGDSGGPVVYAGRIAGVVSWGGGCGSGVPAIYTRFSSLAMTTFLKERISSDCL